MAMESFAVCAITSNKEENYLGPKSGQWLSDDEAKYLTLHRGAVSIKHQGQNLSGRLFEEVLKI